MYRTRPTFVPTRLLNAVTLAFVTSALVPFTPALAACNMTSPASGQTATCDTSAPNPANTPVSALPGSTNVTVNVLPDAELDVSGATGIAVSDQSSVTNLGTLRITGDTFNGMASQGSGAGQNTLINRGLIVVGGNSASGLFNSAPAATMLNDTAGVIQTGGTNAYAMSDVASAGGSALTNDGKLVTTGAGAAGMATFAINDTLINNGAITTAGDSAYGMLARAGTAPGNNVITNNGTITTTGTDAHGIISQDPTPGAITNTGSITAQGPGALGAFIAGKVTFNNVGGASIVSEQANGVDGNGGGTYNNAGTISARNVTLSFADVDATVNNSGTLTSATTEAIASNGPINLVINNTGNIVGGGGRAIFTDVGNDTFNWSAGTIQGFVRMDAGDDVATLTSLTDTNLAGVPSFDGGPGNDVVTFDHTQAGGLSRFINWETVNVTNGSQLTLDSSGLTLGDSGTQTGTLNIDATSTLYAGGLGDPSIMPAVAGRLVNVNNAGTIDLTNGGTSTTDALVVNGNYTGSNGRLLLQVVLGADGSPADRLVIAQGTGSGNTALGVTNSGGAGGLTVTDGIMVVQTTNGATTTANAFTLPKPLVAGAYVYYLFKGGVSAGTADNWYLRSSLPPAPVTSPTSTSMSAPQASEGTPPLPAPPPAGSAPTPLYRMEVPVYAEVPALTRELGVAQIGTFHDRQGEQSLLGETGALPAAWARVWGEHATQRNGGGVDPEFSGAMGGVQVGHDVYADRTASGHRNHYGFFVGAARAEGDVSGLALGFPDLAAGHLAINAYSIGGYWTHIGPGGWYTDAILMGSTLTIDPSSNQGIGATTHGHTVGASLEGGLPIALSTILSIEPQMQLIWQHTSISDLNDGISGVSFHAASGLTGRLGVRLAGRFDAAGTAWQPYLRVNLWHDFGGTDNATFAGATVIPVSVSATSAQFQLGIVAKVSVRGSVFANAGYTTNVNGEHRSIVAGDVGVRWYW